MAPYRVSVAILALVFVFIAALLGMRAWSLLGERETTVARAELGMRNLARVVEQYAERVFETSDLVAEQVILRTAELGGTEALRGAPSAHRWLRDLSARSAGDHLMVTDAAGRPVALSAAETPPAVSLSDRHWFRAHALDGEERHVGQALHSRITDEILFTYSRMLRRVDGSFDGVVQVSVRTGFFDRPDAAAFGSGAIMGLFDAEGRVLARTGLQPQELQLSLRGTALFDAMQTGGHGIVHGTMPFDGTERIIAFRRLDRWPVIVTASVPMEEVLASWYRDLRWSLEALGLVTLGLLLLATLAIRMANREARARAALADANRALRDAAVGLETRVAERTRDLAASELRFRVIFDSTFQLMSLLDPDGVVLEANETALHFLGLSRGRLVGRRLEELPCWPDQAARRRIAGAISEAGKGRPQRSEMVARTADGRVAPIEVSLCPVRGADGEIAWVIAECHDLTELKAAEARLREAQKMEALGQLTGGVAHDFNNLLMVVLGNLGLLRKRLPPDPRIQRLLDGAQQGAERGAALTQRMLAFARRQELRPVPVDLAVLAGGIAPLLERSAGPKVRIVARLPDGLPAALVDANQLELALLNLVVNARDAMPEGGEVEITAAAAEAPSPAAPPGIAPGRYLRIAVRDSGSGMDPATLARATEPFFTTKGVGRGSGLGLSMVQGLAQQSGGGLRLDSRPGAGTTAEIWLPRAEAEVAPPTAALQSPDHSPRHRATVLVVDDDPLVATGTAMMLEDLGHEAFVATSAAEALAQLGRSLEVDLVLTDHAMPGMTGLELAERLRDERPELPVALATGYAELPSDATAWLTRLNKPYRQEELDSVVRRLARAPVAE